VVRVQPQKGTCFYLKPIVRDPGIDTVGQVNRCCLCLTDRWLKTSLQNEEQIADRRTNRCIDQRWEIGQVQRTRTVWRHPRRLAVGICNNNIPTSTELGLTLACKWITCDVRPFCCHHSREMLYSSFHVTWSAKKIELPVHFLYFKYFRNE
jgi:hypothetical protein